MSEPKLIVLQIDEAKIIEAVVEQLVTRGTYSDDGEDWYPSKLSEKLQARIEARLEEVVESAIGDEFKAMVRARVEPVIESAVASGFPRFDRDGRALAPEPFAAYVRGAIDGMFKSTGHYSRKSEATEIAEKLFREHVEKAFKEELEAIRSRVRSYVDEQLAGTVIKSLREAVGLKG